MNNSGVRPASAQAKVKRYQKLGRLLWQHGWLLFLGLALAGWCLFAFTSHSEDLGLSKSFFGVFSGSMATLLGVLLGLTVAAVALIIQSTLMTWRTNKSRLLSEAKWLQSFVETEHVESEDLQAKLDSMISICRIPPPFLSRPKQPIGFGKVAGELIEAIGREQDDVSKKIDETTRGIETPQQSDGPGGAQSSDVFSHASSLEEVRSRLRSLDQLLEHSGNILEASFGLQAAAFSMGIARMFMSAALLGGIGLVAVVALMFWGGLESAGEESVSSVARLRAAGFQVWVLMASLLWAFKNLTFYMDVLRTSEVSDEIERWA